MAHEVTELLLMAGLSSCHPLVWVSWGLFSLRQVLSGCQYVVMQSGLVKTPLAQPETCHLHSTRWCATDDTRYVG